MKICSIEQCDEKAVGRGLCMKHFQRMRRHGDPNTVHKIREKTEEQRKNEARERMSLLHNSRREVGVCYRCGGIKLPDREKCGECIRKGQEHQRKQRAAQQLTKKKKTV